MFNNLMLIGLVKNYFLQIPNAPTKPSTYDILCEYARKKNA